MIQQSSMHFLESVQNSKYNQWYKYLAIILLTLVGGQLLGVIPLAAFTIYKGVETGEMNSMENGIDLSMFGVSHTVTLVFILIPFLVSFLFYVLFFKTIHRRSWLTSINGTKSIRWKRFFLGVGVWGLLSLLLFLLSYFLNPEDFVVQFDIKKWVPLLVVSVLFIPIQTTYEELLFRGYLAQGVGSIFRNRILVILLPSIGFALLHAFNPEIEKYGFWIMMPQYFTIGATYAIISVLDDGIEIAMGAHAINNVFAAVMLNYEGGALMTDAAFLQKDLNPSSELIGLLIISALLCWVLGRFLKWDWSILFKKIHRVETESEVNIPPT